MKVLFVCSGNICRSPMAEAYFRHVVERERLAGVQVHSQGTLRINGAPAAPEAVAAMKEIDIDLTPHRSCGIDRDSILAADLVIGMSHDHLVVLAGRHPEGGGERYLVRAFEAGPDPDPNPRDLHDPITEPIAAFREQRDLLVVCLDHLGEYVRRRL